MSWELLLEIVCICVELANHIVNFVDVGLQGIFLRLYLLVPDLREQSLDVGLRLIRISKHLEISTSVLPSQDIGLCFHNSALLHEEIFSDDVGTPFSLNSQGRRLLYHALLPFVISPSNEPFYCRLDQDESATPPLIIESGLEPSKYSLNVNYKIMLGDLQDIVGVPSLVLVYDKQVFYDKSQLLVAHQTRVVHSGIGELVTEDLFIASIKWMLASYDLIQCDSERPHVSSSPVPLQIDHLRRPIDQRMRHCLSNQYFAKELMSMPRCIKFNFSELAEKRSVVTLYVN